MNVHKNARLTPYRRAQLVAQVEQGTPLAVVARAFGVSRQTAAKWRERQRAAGVPADQAWLQDRSSRPHRSPRQTAPHVQLGARVLRQQRWTCAEIAAAVGVSAATIARGLRRVGMSRRQRMEPPPMGRRYEHPAAGDLVHLGHQETRADSRPGPSHYRPPDPPHPGHRLGVSPHRHR